MVTRTIRKKYSHAITDTKKDQKRKEAKTRQAKRSTRSNTQQLKLLNTNGHIAKKERARLNK